MSDCLFCKIIAKEIPAAFVYADDRVVAFLDVQPVNPGHTLFITRRHCPDLFAATSDDLHHLVDVISRVAPAILKTVGATDFNLIENNGAVAGQAVAHLHFHVIPRHAGDGRESWHAPSVDIETRQSLSEKIKTVHSSQ